MFLLTQILIALSAAGSTIAAPLSNHSAPTIAERSASYTGDITYYQPGLGACGETNSDGEAVVAMSPSEFDGNCGKMITITANGKKAVAKVVDKCPGCASGAIDVSSSVFQTLADLSVGRTTVNWSFS